MVKTLLPLMRKPAPSGVALVFSSVTAEPASGSVMPTEISAPPSSSGASHLAFCATEPYSASTRIAPKLPAWITSALRGQCAATAWMAMMASISVPPCPPSASAMVMPSRPCAAIFFATSQG
ncbi:hypothetical protein D3C85_1297940 [compost metagenome]